MVTRGFRGAGIALAALALTASGVMAGVTFDPASGEGFVGKGDVQLIYGWNNAQLQANADQVQFRAISRVVTERSWECTNSNNQMIRERVRETTTTTQGLVDSVTRERRQITGFTLDGYSGDGPTVSSATDGPQLNSCPSGPWSLTSPAGAAVEVSSSSKVQVSIDGINWFDLN